MRNLLRSRRGSAAFATVIALVPLSIWTSTLLGSTAAILSLILIARARSLAPAK